MDIVNELEELQSVLFRVVGDKAPLITRAIAEIERLRSQVNQMSKANDTTFLDIKNLREIKDGLSGRTS